MAKKGKKGTRVGKVEQPKLNTQPKAETHDLEALRKAVVDADADWTKAATEAEALVDRGFELTTKALRRYRETVALYSEACRKAGVKCEFPVWPSEGENSNITFFVEKSDDGFHVLMKGKARREDAFGLAFLKASLRRARIGSRAPAGSKVGTVADRLRDPMGEKK